MPYNAELMQGLAESPQDITRRRIIAFNELKRTGKSTKESKAGVFAASDGRKPSCNCPIVDYSINHRCGCKVPDLLIGYNVYMNLKMMGR